MRNRRFVALGILYRLVERDVAGARARELRSRLATKALRAIALVTSRHLELGEGRRAWIRRLELVWADGLPADGALLADHAIVV